MLTAKYLFGFAATKRFNHGRIVNNKFTNVKQIIVALSIGGLHPRSWTKYVRIVVRNPLPGKREKVGPVSL